MKRFLFAIAVSLLGIACSSNLDDEIITTQSFAYPDLTAELEAETRTYVENDKYLRWHENDRLTVFFGNTLNNQYKFKGKTGDNSGTFSLIPSGELGTGNSLESIYAIYPYDADATITDTGIITYNLPSVQNYAENSFGKNANTMVAVTNGVEDTFLSFKNVCGYLKLKLYGYATIKNIEVKGNFAEKIAGNATITATYGDIPTFTMNSDASTTIKVDCADGVTLGTTSNDATVFWVVIPETTFKYGITITATDVNGKVFTKTTNKSIAIERNAILPMSALEFVGESSDINPIENTTITYTTDDGNIVDIFTTEGFGANIVANNYDKDNNIGTITFDGAITTIPAEAFQVCTNLTSIQLPNTITAIAEKAFYGCNYMEKIIIPESVETIGPSAFTNCTGEAIIQCEIGDNAFEGASFSKVTITNTITGKEAFMNCANLKTVELPDGLTTIPYCTFQNSALENISIPETVETIEDGAFYQCSKLKKIIIPESVKVFGLGAFQECTALQEIKMPTNMTSVGEAAFRGCKSLVECTIPEGVTSLESYTFYSCIALSDVTLTENISTIGNGAFKDCVALASISLPESITAIGDEAFRGCRNLQEIIIPSQVTAINWCVFGDCSKLTNVRLNNKITTIGGSAFAGCSELEYINLPESLSSIGNNAFEYCSSLQNITIPNGITSIGYYTFNSAGISQITLPETLKTIGYSFPFCNNLKEIVIPASVTEIATHAFSSCINLARVYFRSKTPPTIGAFLSGNAGCYTDLGYTQIFVPQDVVEAYKTATPDYTDQIVGYDFE